MINYSPVSSKNNRGMWMSVTEGADMEGHLAASYCGDNLRDLWNGPGGGENCSCWSFAAKLSSLWVRQDKRNISLTLGPSFQPSNMLKSHSIFTKASLSHLSRHIISKVTLLARVPVCRIRVSPQ